MFDRIARWPRVSLRSICTSKQGLTFSPEQLVPIGTSDAVACFRTKNVQGDLEVSDLIFLPKRDVSDDILVREGDVLVSTANSANLVGKCCIVGALDFPATYGGFLVLLRPDSSALSPQFFHAWLSCEPIQSQLRSMARQTTNIANLPASEILRLNIPLPPLSEQRRIVEILREAETVRRHQAQAARTAAELIPSLFQQMFGDPINAPRNSIKASVESFVAEFEGGKSLSDDGASDASPYRVLKISAVTSGSFRPEESKPAPSDLEPESGHFVRKGDLLISRANTEALVGATAIVHEKYPNLLLPDKLWRFVFRDPDRQEPEFVYHLFQNANVRRALSARASGTGGSMKNIGKGRLLSMQVALPPIEAQRRFLALVSDTQRSHAPESLTSELHAALLARAFNGSLTENWRERNAALLATEAAARDTALAAKGIKAATVGPTIRINEDGKTNPNDTPTSEAWADLTERQRALWPFIAYIQGPFGVTDLLHSRHKDDKLALLSEDGFRRELEVFVARGAIVHVSRPQIASEDERDVFRHYYRKVSVPENEATWNAPSVKAIAESLRSRLTS